VLLVYRLLLLTNSEVTANGITETEMGQTLLNGNNIAMVCLPGLALSARPIIRAEGWADGIVDSRRTGSKSIVGTIWIGSQLEIALVIKGDLGDQCRRTIKASHKKCMNTSSPRTKVDTIEQFIIVMILHLARIYDFNTIIRLYNLNPKLNQI